MKYFNININKDFFILGSGIVLKLLITIINSRLITFYLNESNLTSFYLVISIYSFFSLGFVNPLNLFFTKYLFTFHKKNHLFEAFYFLFKKFLIMPLLLYVLVLIYYFSFNDFEYFLIAILIIYLISKSLNDTLFSVFNIVERNKRFVFLVNLNLFLSIVLSFLFIQVFEINYINWFIGIVASQIIMMIIGTNLYINTYKKDFLINNKEVFNPENYNLSNKNYYFFIITNLLGWFFIEGYKLFFDFYLDKEILINFLIGFILASQVISTVESFNQQLNAPKFLQIVNKNDENILLDTFLVMLKKSIFILTLAFIVFFIFDKIIINILVDSSKINKEVFYYFKIGLCYATINALFNIFKLLFMTKFELKKIFISFFAGIMIFILLFNIWSEVNFAVILLIGLLFSKLILVSYYLRNFYKIKNEI